MITMERFDVLDSKNKPRVSYKRCLILAIYKGSDLVVDDRSFMLLVISTTLCSSDRERPLNNFSRCRVGQKKCVVFHCYRTVSNRGI